MANGEDYRGLLTDPFTRDLAGDDGYVTLLTEIRARDLLYESAWWSLVGELRGAGHLNDDSFGRLLDRLHARELLSDADYGRRGGTGPAGATGRRSRPGSSARSVSQEPAAEAVRVAERGLSRRAAWGAVRCRWKSPTTGGWKQ